MRKKDGNGERRRFRKTGHEGVEKRKKKQFSKFRFRNYTSVRFVFCLRRNIIPISEGGYLGKQIRHIPCIRKGHKKKIKLKEENERKTLLK